jgi:hypothetical protein
MQEAEPCCIEDQTAFDAPESTEGAVIEGQIAAVDHESGRFVLDTDDGPFSLVTSPDELSGIDVGDVVRVSFVRDESD